jgi:hypothetical protein
MTPRTLLTLHQRLGLMQEQFADLIGIHWNSYARMERGDMGLRPSTAWLIQMVAEKEMKRRGPKR